MSDTVCAVVVSHNRKDLLRQCLSALRDQTYSVKEIIVVENASSDGTKEMLAEEFPELTVENLEMNLGGAGGFHHGIARARAKGYEWIWLMDDDSLATPGALAGLIAACGEQDDGAWPAILASKVVWTDGELHPMNKPVLKLEKHDDLFACAARGLLPIRCASFVSVLIRGDIVDKYGLPFADYFIWNDDVEYTARILKENTGWWVSSSLVIHQTVDKVVKPEDIRINRYYYSIRNRLWMVRRSNAWSVREKLAILKTVIVVALRLPRRAGFRKEVLSIIGRGFMDGLLTSPLK
jgi:rhamnopyranosyl-N-acetylglucosaminyl-diphospho-decaprenol beta-1,3/1,4-galactofuranosyltransferase